MVEIFNSMEMLNTHIWTLVEDALTPLPDGSKASRLYHTLSCCPLFPAGLITGSVVLAEKAFRYGSSFFTHQKEKDPVQDFSSIEQDSRLWAKLGNLRNKITLGIADPNFLFGTATCTYQDSGAENCPNSQWASWELKKVPEDNRSGKSANLFTLYQTQEGREEIIDRLQKLGVNTYRFSIEWSHIEPREGEFHKEMLDVYIELCKALRDAKIQPLVTLHHFSEPQWFHDKGSFEKEENIPYFKRFVEYVALPMSQPYKTSANLVPYVCTINEPTIEAFSRYVLKAFSPGDTLNFKRAGLFLKGILKAHSIAYDVLKAKAPLMQVGIVHQYLAFEAANPLLSFIPRYFNRLTNETALRFFKTGLFELKIPFLCNIHEQVEEKPKTDFVGLQYYVRPVIGFGGSVGYHDEPQTLMPMREDPAGLYRAVIETYNAFQKPIIVTENGISTNSDEQRSRYLERAIYALQRAQDMIGKQNVLGYFVWSLCDNFEWDRGMKPQAFGLYSVEDGKLSTKPKKGADPFVHLSQNWQKVHRLKSSQTRTIQSLFSSIFKHSKRKHVQTVK
jgi:beta-glucosidase